MAVDKGITSIVAVNKLVHVLQKLRQVKPHVVFVKRFIGSCFDMDNPYTLLVVNDGGYVRLVAPGENIDVIRMAAEACGNKFMEHQIKTIAIPMMLERGKGLTEAFEATGVFTKTAISRFNSGAETGTVRQTAIQLAEYYEKETTYRLVVLSFVWAMTGRRWLAIVVAAILFGAYHLTPLSGNYLTFLKFPVSQFLRG
jgi:hypothetical protein